MEVDRVGNLEVPFYTHARSSLPHRDHKRMTESCRRCPPSLPLSLLSSFWADQLAFWAMVREEEALRLTRLVLPQGGQKNRAVSYIVGVWVQLVKMSTEQRLF